MRPIRIYLIVYSDKGGWQSTVHRDVDEVLQTWLSFFENGGAIGFVHVGLNRPPSIEFEPTAVTWTNRLLVSTSARWAFDALGTYSAKIAEVGSLGLHLAFSGWGYVADRDEATQDLEDIAQPSAVPTTTAQGLDVYGGSAWFHALSTSNPAAYHAAATRGIIDETTYITVEEAMPWALRKALAIERASFLMREHDSSDPTAVSRALPPWVVSASLNALPLTARCANSLQAGGIRTVDELRQMNSNHLLKLPNFGKKSQKDLARSLWEALSAGPPEGVGDKRAFDIPSRISNSFDDQLELIERPTWRSFREAFDASLSSLKKNVQTVVRSRIGTGQRRMTLADIGDEMGVTRERIRQLEGNAIQFLKRDPFWSKVLLRKIADLLDERDDSLPVASLGLFDPFFAGSESMLGEIDFVLRRVLDEPFHILRVNGCDFITEISQEEWNATVRHALNLVETALPTEPSKQDLRRQVEGLLGQRGHELAAELWVCAKNFALFAIDGEGVERLAGAGTSAESLVAATLASSDNALHFLDIARLVEETFGRKIDIRRAHSAAAKVGVLFGRGTYGTAKHCPLGAEEVAVLRREAEDIVLSGPSNRQWSCFELAQKLHELSLDFDEHIDQYVVDFALRESEILSDLGRLMWVQSGKRATGTADRIDVSQAVLALLSAAGMPMSKTEIRRELSRDRGLSGFFQIQPKGSLVKVDEDRWGILERDVPLTLTELTDLYIFVAAALEQSQQGLHLSETMDALRMGFPAINKVESPYTVHGVLQMDPRFKVSPSGYVYLACWGSPKRISQGEAVIELFRRNPGCRLTNREIVSRASDILGRPIDKFNIYGALRTIGAQFDDSSGTWHVDNLEADEELQVGGSASRCFSE